MIWVRPAAGLWFGVASVDKEKRGGNGSFVVGSLAVQLGLIGGGVLGFGRSFGLTTGVFGALALAPLLGFGFVGIPLGIHFGRRFGIGIVIPVITCAWWVGLLVAVSCAAVSTLVALASQDSLEEVTHD